MDLQPQLCPAVLREQLRPRFERRCQQVADAVNHAPAGHVLDASEEKGRDLFADFRQEAYQAAVQARLTAAQAACPPSAAPRHRPAAAEPGP